MITLYQIATTVLESAKDVGDVDVMTDCRRVISAVKHGRDLPKAEIARVKAVYGELVS